MQVTIRRIQFIMQVVGTRCVIFGGRERTNVAIVFGEGGDIANLAMQLSFQIIVFSAEDGIFG